MPIRKYGDEVLREEAVPIERVNGEIKALVDNMIATMRAEKGVGLAAQQVGDTRAVCVIDVPVEYDTDEEGVRINPDIPMPLVMINPKIVEESEDMATADEGCLSFPSLYAPVRRHTEVVVEYTDLDGKSHKARGRHFLARAMQHEIDHLNGVLFVDRVSSLKKISISGQLKRLKKETQAELGA